MSYSLFRPIDASTSSILNSPRLCEEMMDSGNRSEMDESTARAASSVFDRAIGLDLDLGSKKLSLSAIWLLDDYCSEEMEGAAQEFYSLDSTPKTAEASILLKNTHQIGKKSRQMPAVRREANRMSAAESRERNKKEVADLVLRVKTLEETVSSLFEENPTKFLPSRVSSDGCIKALMSRYEIKQIKPKQDPKRSAGLKVHNQEKLALEAKIAKSRSSSKVKVALEEELRLVKNKISAWKTRSKNLLEFEGMKNRCEALNALMVKMRG